MTMPKGKQFDFSETQIFGKFDLFCRRVIKLIDMFGTIHHIILSISIPPSRAERTFRINQNIQTFFSKSNKENPLS